MSQKNSAANTPAGPSSNSHTSPSPQNTPQHITLPEPFVNKLRKQIEFYFSTQNLLKDQYLRNIMMQYGGSFVPLVVICQFPKVMRLCESFNLAVDPFMILRVMEGSSVVFVTMDAVWIGIRHPVGQGVVGGQGVVQGGPPQPQGQPSLPMPTGPVRATSLGVMPNPMNNVAGTNSTPAAGTPTLVSPPSTTAATTPTTTTTTTGKDTPTSHTTSASNESSPSSSSLPQNHQTSHTDTTAAAVPVHPTSSQTPPVPVSPSRNVPRPNLQMRSHTTGQFTRMHPYNMYPPNHGHTHGHPMMRPPAGGMVPPPPPPQYYGNVMMPPMRGNVRYMQGYTYVGSTMSSMPGYKYFHPNQNNGTGRPPVVMGGNSVASGNSGGNQSGGNHSGENQRDNRGNHGGMPKSSSTSNLSKNNRENGTRKSMDKKKKKEKGTRNTNDTKKKKKKDVNLDVNHFPALGGGKKEEEKKVVVPVVSGYAAALLAKKEKKAQDVSGNSDVVTASEETSVQELEKQVSAMSMENDAIAVGALTGSPVKISHDGVDGTEKTMPQSKKIESIEIDGPTPKEAALPQKSEALDGKVDSVAVQQDAKTPSTETSAPVSSSSNSPPPPAAWGGKRSFIDVVKKQP
ncbi:hypothetical protein CTEN210_18186 [Chaetoceros tenuissimus]|uniref:HTH La-type RNA-binding domain-containing protein n=1 Tax=Chaetoceros tenuissimus TaxID=426638 RepID=A0AAD3DE35_9STRA|nr:hypothetical protein CTEN210_18186 [Chaetoceros tenuissimus]